MGRRTSPEAGVRSPAAASFGAAGWQAGTAWCPRPESKCRRCPRYGTGPCPPLRRGSRAPGRKATSEPGLGRPRKRPRPARRADARARRGRTRVLPKPGQGRRLEPIRGSDRGVASACGGPLGPGILRVAITRRPRIRSMRQPPAASDPETGIFQGRSIARRFVSPDGYTVLVGKAAADNDTLTFRLGAPHDFWLHVAAESGSHVIVRNPEGISRLPRDTLRFAAALAAGYSKARSGGPVAVHACVCRRAQARNIHPAWRRSTASRSSGDTEPGRSELEARRLLDRRKTSWSGLAAVDQRLNPVLLPRAATEGHARCPLERDSTSAGVMAT